MSFLSSLDVGPLLLAAAAGEGGGHEGSLVGVFVGIVLLFLNAFFVAAEIALLAARRGRIEEMAEQGDPRAQMSLEALKELSVTFSGAQLGITMTSLGLGAVAEPAVAGYLETWLGATGLSQGASTTIGFSLGLGLVVFLHMVIGEMVPKNLALADAEKVSLRLARPFRLFVRIFRPLIVFLNGLGNFVVRRLGVEPVDEHGLVHTPEELRLVVRESHEGGQLRPSDARVLSAVLRLGEIDAESGMTPRVDLVSVPDTASPDDVLALARTTGFTRFPVHHEVVDEMIGLVHVKDVLIAEPAQLASGTITELIRPLAAVPESRDLEHLLRDMRAGREHAVLVVDEFGGTAGLLTLEDVVEELLGEIADEYDPAEPAADHRPGGPWVVPGTLRKDELEVRTGCRLPDSAAETVSGWLTEQVGRLVEVGDRRDVAGHRLEVQTLEGRRAGDVLVQRINPGTS